MATATMQRRHFELIAENIASARDEACGDASMIDGVLAVASHLAHAFEQTNDRFDRDRFIKACGFQP